MQGGNLKDMSLNYAFSSASGRREGANHCFIYMPYKSISMYPPTFCFLRQLVECLGFSHLTVEKNATFHQAPKGNILVSPWSPFVRLAPDSVTNNALNLG